MPVGAARKSEGMPLWKPILAGVGLITGIALMALAGGAHFKLFSIPILKAQIATYGTYGVGGLGALITLVFSAAGVHLIRQARSSEQEVVLSDPVLTSGPPEMGSAPDAVKILASLPDPDDGELENLLERLEPLFALLEQEDTIGTDGLYRLGANADDVQSEFNVFLQEGKITSVDPILIAQIIKKTLREQVSLISFSAFNEHFAGVDLDDIGALEDALATVFGELPEGKHQLFGRLIQHFAKIAATDSNMDAKALANLIFPLVMYNNKAVTEPNEIDYSKLFQRCIEQMQMNQEWLTEVE